MTKTFADMDGMADARRMLGEVAPRVAKNIARSTMYAVAKVARDHVRDEVPVATGNLKAGIKHRRTRAKAGSQDVSAEVYAERKQFYWRFVARGTAERTADPFDERALARLQPQLPNLLREMFGRQFERTMAREARRAAKKAAAG